MANVLITGGTGLVGKLLKQKLVDMNYMVRVLTRNPKKENDFYWNLSTNEIDERAFKDLDYIVHLAGAGIADKRWSGTRKQEIIDSRTKSTELLHAKITEFKIPLKGFIAASAIGYYGAITSESMFKESDKPANDFIGTVCQQWEMSSLKFKAINIPTTILRIGIVLSKNGGVLEKMNTSFAIYPIASGKQYMPWIHIEDLSNLFIKAIENNSFIGIFNAVAPEHQNNYSFSKTLAKKSKKLFFPIGVPKLLLQIIFGDMAILLTTGSRVSSQKLEETGYVFSYKKLDQAFEDLI